MDYDSKLENKLNINIKSMLYLMPKESFMRQFYGLNRANLSELQWLSFTMGIPNFIGFII